MANFKKVIFWLKNKKKVRRPSWKEGSYWILGKYQRICWSNGTTAHIHINQIESTDFELYKERTKLIILDDNELSILKYAQEFPENWKKICDSLDKKGIKNDN